MNHLGFEGHGKQENESLESEFNDIYQRDYLDALPKVLDRKFVADDGEPLFLSGDGTHFDTLRGLIDHLLNGTDLNNKEEVVKSIIDNMSRIPAGQSMSPRHAAETGEMYCSVSAAVFQLIMEKIQSQLDIETEYVNPVDHAANIIRFPGLQGDRIFYADPRNGIFEELTSNITEEDRGSFKIYRAKNRGALSAKVLFSVIPSIADSSKAMVYADMGNLEGMVDFARGNFGEDSERMGIELAHKLQESARKHLEGLGILGDKDKEEAFRRKYAQLEGFVGKDLKDFKETGEFKAEEKRVSVEKVMSDEWNKIPDEVKRSLLADEQFASLVLHGNNNKVLEIIGNDTQDSAGILEALEAIREAFGMRWIISDISTDAEKMADLKPFLDQAKKSWEKPE